MRNRFTNRNRNSEPLNDEQIQHRAPSAFAGQAYEKQSDRYTFLPTIDVINGMREAGFAPVDAMQSRSRIAGKAEFTKHMLRFRAQDQGMTIVGDSAIEAVLVNSHDGTSSYRLSMGVFRLVCSNGLVVADSLVGSLAVRHVGNITQSVIDATREMLSNAPLVIETINAWRQIQLVRSEQLALAEAAHSLRFADNARMGAAVPVEKLLETRRYNDNGNDLYSTFNRIQENTVRGGVRGLDRGADGTQAVRRIRTREVTGIDQNVTLNKALWTLGERMAELKKNS